MNKASLLAFTVLALGSASVFAAEPGSAPLTRAQVTAELKALQSVGYDANVNDPEYPEQLLAAQQRLARRQGLAQAPLTRAQVKAELSALRSVGYDANVDDPDYPASLTAAQQRLAARENPGLQVAQQPTRQQVKDEITALRGVGYDVNRTDPDYPNDIEQAEARLADVQRARALAKQNRDQRQQANTAVQAAGDVARTGTAVTPAGDGS